MSAAIDKCYWYGSIILPTSAFSFDCSIKIWPRCSCVDSIMHSTRTFVIIVSNDRVPCRPHLDHLAAAVIVARASCYLTAADHCYVMSGIIKFGDKSINDSSARRLDHCGVIASCSEVRRAAQRSWTPNRDQIIYSSSFGVNHKPTRELHSWRRIRQMQQFSLWLHHSHCSIGCWTNNTLAARSLSPNKRTVSHYTIKVNSCQH